MDTIVDIPKHDNTKRIVIIGGGFAGLELANRVNKKQYQVVLIDKNNYHQFQPLFYQVATAGLDPSSICYPLRKNFHRVNNFHFRMCEARQVYAQEKRVATSIGDLYYDYLVVATGCDTNYFGSDSLRESTYALKSISEAILARNRILLSFEQAANNTNKEELLSQSLCFTIVGGGATGVELAGALADMKKFVLPKDYPEINFEKMEIHLIDASMRLLAGLSERASKTAADTLQKRGVILHLNVRVTAYDKPIVKLSDNTELRSTNVFWVGGVKANNIVGLSESAYLHGRLAVDEYNEVIGHKDIFAIGDTSLLITEANPKGHPQVAQVALQMARSLSRNLNNKAREGKAKRFEYINKGSMATIGKNAAVADIGQFYFRGFLAWWIWLLIHIMSMIGIRNKILVLIDWVWNYFGYGLSLRLFIRPKNSKIYDE